MYKVGDYVFCASGGVWKLTSISNDTYFLQKHESNDKKEITIANNKEIIRRISNKEDILDSVDRVCFIQTIQAPNDKTRRALYEDSLKEFVEIEWIKIIKSVYIRKTDGRLMQNEEEFAERAKSFFYGEISVVMGMPVSEVEDYINAAVSNDKW